MIGDIGGFKELVPVADLLRERGCATIWTVDPKGRAEDLMTRGGIEFLRHEEGLPSKLMPVPNLVLVGTSATACGAQIAWTNHFKGKRPVVWYEDLYGTGEVKVARQCTSPNVIITIDEVSRGIAAHVWPDTHVLVGGKPTYGEKLVHLIQRKENLRESLRSKLASHNPPPLLVTYASGGESVDRVLAHIRALSQAFDHSERIALRFHPKLSESFDLLNDTASQWLSEKLIDTSAITDTTEVILGSDIVVADYAGDPPYQAALAEIPVIMTLFPDCTEALIARGYQNGVPPLLQARACWGARTADDMEVIAEGIMNKPLPARAMVKEGVKPFESLLAQNAAIKIADIIENCLN